jgi:spermidine synthase
VAFVAGAIIALQIAIMRIFAVGSWAHFGSLVVSLAMLGFGLASVVICIAKDWFERHWRAATAIALLLLGPLVVVSSLAAQTVPFNAIFLVSDPSQKWRLLANFVLYLLPFLAGAVFLGVVFLKSRLAFGRVYFADLTGSGIAGVVVLASMYALAPEDLLFVPLVLWAIGTVIWSNSLGNNCGAVTMAVIALLTAAAYAFVPAALDIPQIAVSQYKGIAYARNFPDAKRVIRNISPFGDLQVYASSYMHFAPGLSDNAAFNVPELPANTYLGMYIDGEGPDGIMRDIPQADLAHFRFLPSFYPYVLKQQPKTFVAQFGGGISTRAAFGNSKSVTVAEGNPAVLEVFRDSLLRDAGGDILSNPKVRVVDYDGRLYLANTRERYDIVDLSLADSVGLSNPGGFAITEKYAYTSEAMLTYMRALADGGILAVTLWNKEEPPKSILKLYTTIVDAARTFNAAAIANSFFVVSSYLSTTTVLYKNGGFTVDEIAKLRDYTKAMSFDEIYYPGKAFDPMEGADVLNNYRESIFGAQFANPATDPAPTSAADPADPTLGGGDPDMPLPATAMERLTWHSLIDGGWDDVAREYIFDTRPLTNDRPYFAAYVKPADLMRTLDRLELFQDDWGYLLLWATLAIAIAAAASLIVLPVAFAWRSAFVHYPGKLGAIVYFACLGLGYIMVEVGLIGRFTLALTNPTISASILITGMLVFSGIGSLLSERIFDRAKSVMPAIFLAIAALLFGYAYFLGPVLEWIASLPYLLRLFCCFCLVAPPALLMGFPMSTGMTWLARLGKDKMFVWAWGINGCFSVIGAAAVPIVSTAFGLAAVLQVSGAVYALAGVAFFAVVSPPQWTRQAPAA